MKLDSVVDHIAHSLIACIFKKLMQRFHKRSKVKIYGRGLFVIMYSALSVIYHKKEHFFSFNFGLFNINKVISS